MPDGADRYELFLSHYARAQAPLQAFVRSLVHDRASADDVFQSTSMTLWRRFDSYRDTEPFVPWALGIARHEVLHFWRSRRRDRLVFSEAALGQLADLAMELAPEADPRQAILESCVESLPERQRQLLSMFYVQQMRAEQIAAVWQRTVHAVYKALKVTRRALVECVERKQAANA